MTGSDLEYYQICGRVFGSFLTVEKFIERNIKFLSVTIQIPVSANIYKNCDRSVLIGFATYGIIILMTSSGGLEREGILMWLLGLTRRRFFSARIGFEETK
ncbi:hypothetical protein ES705_07902 [subsurface metagenome]